MCTSSLMHTCIVLGVTVDVVTVLVPTSAPASLGIGGQIAHRGAPARMECAMTVYNHPFLHHSPHCLFHSFFPPFLRPGGNRDMFGMQLHGLCRTKLRPLYFQCSGSNHCGDSDCCHPHYCTRCVVHQEVRKPLVITITQMKLTSSTLIQHG